jgi:hypothetical protein
VPIELVLFRELSARSPIGDGMKHKAAMTKASGPVPHYKEDNEAPAASHFPDR